MSFLTANMGLRAWDQGDDPYDHSQLANNFTAIDAHDHSPGKGRLIRREGIADGAIDSSKILDASIQTVDLADGSVTGPKIADNSITASKIQDGAIGTNKLADGAVTFAKLDPSVMPIGAVISWYRPNNSVSPPSGWEVCDGRPWSTITNAWGVTIGNIPDLRNKFILGASTVGPFGTNPSDTPDIGMSGGSQSANFAHTHSIAGESPGMSTQSGGYIGAGGNHRHYGVWPIVQDQALSNTYYIVKPGDSSIEAGQPTTLTEGAFVAYDINGLPTAQSAYTLASGGFNLSPGTAVQTFRQGTSFSGDHSHFLDAHSHTVNNHSHGGATGSSLSTVDKRPAYVGLLQIMRVR